MDISVHIFHSKISVFRIDPTSIIFTETTSLLIEQVLWSIWSSLHIRHVIKQAHKQYAVINNTSQPVIQYVHRRAYDYRIDCSTNRNILRKHRVIFINNKRMVLEYCCPYSFLSDIQNGHQQTKYLVVSNLATCGK